MNLDELGVRQSDFFQARVAHAAGVFRLGRRRGRLRCLLGGVGGGGFLDLVRLLAHGGNVPRSPTAVNRTESKSPRRRGA